MSIIAGALHVISSEMVASAISGAITYVAGRMRTISESQKGDDK
jgi:hypothetical protein